MTKGSPGRRRPAARAARHGDRFGLLLLVLISAYVLSAFASGTVTSAVQIVWFLGAALLAVRSGRIGRRAARLAIAAVVGGSAVAVTLAVTHSADAGAGVANLWTALVLLLAAVLIVRRVLTLPEVTLQSIFGAVSAYMIIGLMFAAILSAMNRFGNGNFFVPAQVASARTQAFQYFSFTTLTTLGYGDYTAAQSSGQAVAVMEAVLGQVFLATLVARLVAAFRGPRSPAQPRARRRVGDGRTGTAGGAPAGRGPGLPGPARGAGPAGTARFATWRYTYFISRPCTASA
jgi:Ion channel